MDPSIQAASGYYVWEVPGKSVVVHLNVAIIDRLAAEVMRGFGLVPKRGAEVGGLLLGSFEEGAQTIVRVEDFEGIACDYKRGPSYFLTDGDREAFEEARALSPSAVGYYRSHTREGLSLGPEDIELMQRFFPSASHIALLVKPFATKVSTASFFFREDGLFQAEAPLEFPFRRRELTGEAAPPRRSMLERTPRRREIAEERRPPVDFIESAPAPLAPLQSSRARSGWAWIPLSFVFLLLGVVLGFQAALTMGPKAPGSRGANYSLGLTVMKDGTNLSVKWDRDAPAVKAAQRGLLEIEDGASTKPVELDQAQLRNGNVLFTNSSGTVRFRLIVYPQAQVTVLQTVEWKESSQ
jgi:hypothetical protein